MRTQKQVMTCNDYNVTLCVNDYKPFHIAYNLIILKVDIEKDRESNIKIIMLRYHHLHLTASPDINLNLASDAEVLIKKQ